jgi:hypothetical protein
MSKSEERTSENTSHERSWIKEGKLSRQLGHPGELEQVANLEHSGRA